MTTAVPTVTIEIGVDHRPERRVGDVAAVELPERQQVQRRRQHAEPAGKHHRVHVDGVAVGHGAEDQLRGPLEEQRLAEVDQVRVSVGAGTIVDSVKP